MKEPRYDEFGNELRRHEWVEIKRRNGKEEKYYKFKIERGGVRIAFLSKTIDGLRKKENALYKQHPYDKQFLNFIRRKLGAEVYNTLWKDFIDEMEEQI